MLITNHNLDPFVCSMQLLVQHACLTLFTLAKVHDDFTKYSLMKVAGSYRNS